MEAGFLSHVDLTVASLTRSCAFYDQLLARIGYRRPTRSRASAPPTWFIFDADRHFFSVSLFPARPDRADREHDRHAPGLNHLAFHVRTRQEVDEVYEFLRGIGARILHAPAEYRYTPGYYAVFFTDPDGLKLEVVHEPAQGARRDLCPSCGAVIHTGKERCQDCGLLMRASGGAEKAGDSA